MVCKKRGVSFQVETKKIVTETVVYVRLTDIDNRSSCTGQVDYTP